jgi:hypothetical protein
MSLLDVLRSGVAVADSILKPLQADVSVERYLGTDGYGTDLWAPAVLMKALVDYTTRAPDTYSGDPFVKVILTFIDINEMVAKTDGKGINDQDKITLPDGVTGPILNLAGFMDAGTGRLLATEVFLGGSD